MLETMAATRTKASTEERILESLERLERRLARVEEIAARADAAAQQAPATIAIAVDAFDRAVGRMHDAGIDLDERGRILLAAIERLTSPAALDALVALLDKVDVVRGLLASGILDPGPVATVARAAEALAESARPGAGAPPRASTLRLLRSLSDPDVQRALGFALQVARRFGRALDESAVAALPRAAHATEASTVEVAR